MADGRLVLSDFGLATDLPDSTMVSVFVGTPHYMAPEVREGDPATTRSDVWSLGVVLHEIFFGKRPERRTSRSVTGVSKPTTTSSTLERAMRALCEKCLADNPADRPENATAVGRLFESARRSPGAILWSRARRRFTYWAVAAVAAAAIVAVGIKARWGSPTPDATLPLPVPRLVNEGKPADWTKVAKVLASVPGHVHCFSLVDANTVRLIWGGPRQAEDVDLSSGVRRTTSLVPEAYATGCPVLSPSGRELLFTANTALGAAEISRSLNPDGRDAKPVTPGWDPVWLMNGEEFAYSIDGAHAAVFSLPTMKFRLLGDQSMGSDQSILGKTASSRGQAVAVMSYVNDSQFVVAVYEGADLAQRTTFAIPGAINFRFAPSGHSVLIAPTEPNAPLAALDWRKGSYRNIGRHAEMALVDAVVTGQTAAVLGRQRLTDVWLYDASGRRPLTTDGNNDAAAISPTGELLVAKSGPRID